MDTYSQQLEQGRIMARLPQHKRKVAVALADIVMLLKQCTQVYVSVSWGKDSTVLAHLAVSVNPEIALVHWGSEQEQYIANFAAVRDDFLAKFGNGCRYIELSDDSLMYSKLRITGRQWSHNNGFDGVLMGLTREESNARRYALGRADSNNIYTYTDGMRRCCPLANWTIDDITAYVAVHELKMLNLYERYGMQIRTSSRIKRAGRTRRGLDYCSSTAQEGIIAFWGA